jgi:hypothetical protein
MNKIIGMTLEEADEYLKIRQHFVREARKDGKDLTLSMNFVTNRINVVTEKGKITKIIDIG